MGGGAFSLELAINQTYFFLLNFLSRLQIRMLLWRLRGRFLDIRGQSPKTRDVA